MFSGCGPGVQARDGCSVELYRRLPYLGDLDPIRSHLTPGTSVLELGCGAGRLTRMLLEWGLRPVSVDDSPEMLAHLPGGARPVLSSIESLVLTESFDFVLLASCLINHPDQRRRTSFLASAARHMKPGAELFVERHDPEWLRTAAIGRAGRAGPADVYLEAVNRAEHAVEMQLRYTISSQSWRHKFAATPLEAEQIEDLLTRGGLHPVSWHGPARRWAVAKR